MKLRAALAARRDAVSRSPHDPLVYAAWRRVTYLESQLDAAEYAEYRTAINQEPRRERRARRGK